MTTVGIKGLSMVSCPTWQIIGHFWDNFHNQSLDWFKTPSLLGLTELNIIRTENNTNLEGPQQRSWKPSPWIAMGSDAQLLSMILINIVKTWTNSWNIDIARVKIFGLLQINLLTKLANVYVRQHQNRQQRYCRMHRQNYLTGHIAFW